MIGKLIQLHQGFVVAIYEEKMDCFLGVVVYNTNDSMSKYPASRCCIAVPRHEASAVAVIDLAPLMELS